MAPQLEAQVTLEDIQMAFRMIAQGRPHQEYAQKLAEALAAVLATPEERLQAIVRDQAESVPTLAALQTDAVDSDPKTAAAPATSDKPKRGRPPNPRPVIDGANDGDGPPQLPESRG